MVEVLVSDAKLKTKIKKFFKAHLEDKGFLLTKARLPERRLAGIRQGIEFQPGSGHLDRKFTLNVYWSYLRPHDNGIAMHACKRIGHLVGGQDTWFSREDDLLDNDFQIVEKLIVDTVFPYFERYSTIERILAAHQRGELSDQDAFGLDAGWRLFNQGYCHAFLGDKAKAIKYYSQVVEQHSDHPYEWVKERKAIAIEQIELLRT